MRGALRGKAISIVRPAYLIGSREHGLANEDDYLWRMIWASVRIGEFNGDENDQWLFVAEADTVAKRVAAMILHEDAYPLSTTLTILDGLSMHAFWEHVSSVLGVSLISKPGHIWLQKVRRDMEKTGNHLLWPLADTLDTSHGYLRKRRCFAEDVSSEIVTSGIDLAIRRNIQHLSSEGFFFRD